MKIKETLINTLVDSMSMEDLQQYVANDMAHFLYHCRESEDDAVQLMWSDDCGIADSEYKSAEAEVVSVEAV